MKLITRASLTQLASRRPKRVDGIAASQSQGCIKLANASTYLYLVIFRMQIINCMDFRPQPPWSLVLDRDMDELRTLSAPSNHRNNYQIFYWLGKSATSPPMLPRDTTLHWAHRRIILLWWKSSRFIDLVTLWFDSHWQALMIKSENRESERHATIV